jgi:phosphoenolpyruvate carboxykinase (ATP)
VPDEVLSSRATWNDDEGYYKAAYKLSESFRENFKKFEEFANDEILAGAPNVR